MMKWINRHIGSGLVTGLVLFSGCSLDEPSSSDSSPALKLLAGQNLSLITLRWDPVKVTGFKEYIILQSSSDIPNQPTPMVSANTTVIKRIDDADVTSFSVSSLLFTPEVCYKLYCAVDDRFLYSSTICIEQDFDMVPGFYDRASHSPDRDEMVMFDRVNHHLSTFNYKSGEITHTVNDIVLNFPSLEMTTWENTTHVFGFDQSPAWLRKYNYPSLTSTQFKNFNQILWAVNVHQQFIFLASEESGKNFQVLNRNTLNVLASRAGMTGVQNIAVFPGDPLTVIAIGINGARKYTIDQNGNIIQEALLTSTISQPDLQSSCAEGAEIFIAGWEGSIINREGDIAGVLNSDLNSSILINRVSPDDKKAIYLLNENGIIRLVIADISNLPLVTKLNTYEIPSLNFADMFVEGGIIYVIGAKFTSSQSQTFVLKYPI